jgi:hypothetical protein
MQQNEKKSVGMQKLQESIAKISLSGQWHRV